MKEIDLIKLQNKFIEEFYKRKDAKLIIPHGEAESYFLIAIDLFSDFLDKEFHQPERLNPETQCRGCKMDNRYPGHAMYVDHCCGKRDVKV